MGWQQGWLAGLLAALAVIAPAGTAASAEDYSCANPIAPCTVCHSPELARDLAKCLAEPWLAPATAKELTSPVPASEKMLRFAKATYEIYCDGCHGPAGDGKGTIALKFSVPAINIGAPSVQAQTDGELFWKISNGKGAMPAWKSLLSDEDRWRLVAFVRTFRTR
jgi:cytochrome c553